MSRFLQIAVSPLTKHPVPSVAAILTLSLGIGANTALFSITNALFLRTPPAVMHVERLVALGRVSSRERWAGFGHLQFQRYRDAARSFSGLAATRDATVLWQDGGPTTPLHVTLVTGGYFAVLGAPIAHGRDFGADEDRTPGAAAVAIVSDAAWRGRFDANPALVGSLIRLNDTDFTVIGIGPPGFTGHEVDARTDVWLPLMMEAEVRPVFPVLNSDFFSSLHPVARLVPGVNLAQAQAEADVLAARLERPPGPRQERMRVQISPHIGLPDPDERAEVVAYLAPLSAAAALVLLIVCANVAGLLLAHMASRRHEIAVRMALGASRGRLVGRLLLEQAGLVVPGAIGGVLVSRWVTALVRVRVAQDMRFDVDAGVLGIAALVAVVAGALFGLLPALHATRVDPVRDLRAARAVGSQGSRLQSALVAGQVAVSLVLCTGAGLMVRTLQKAAAVDVGFETHDLLVVAPDLDLAGYSDVAAGAFYRRYAEAVSAIPGVRSVSWAIATPVDPGFMHGPRQVVVEGGGAPSAMPRVEVDYNEIAPRYFETLGLRVARGRDLRAADDGAAPLVAVINDAMARRDFHGVDPIGQRLRLVLFMDYSPSIEIVGVVPDIRTASLAPDIRPEVFVPLAQSVARKQRLARNAVVLIRVDPGFVSIAAVGGALGRLDPKLSFATVRTLAEQRADHLADRRLYAELLGAFGWLALLLLSIGVYGMLAFDVARQTKAIGVRVALGARRDDVVRLILWHGFKVTGAGLAAGLLGSALVTPVLASLLYGTTPADPPSVAIAVLAIVLVGLVASWLPARRASLIDPIIALRAE